MLGRFLAVNGMKLLGGMSLALAVACGFFYFSWQLSAKEAEAAKERANELQEQVESLQLDIDILQTAAMERAQDEETSRDEREELENASTNPNDTPAERRLRRLCMLRQQQSASSDGLPAACERFTS